MLRLSTLPGVLALASAAFLGCGSQEPTVSNEGLPEQPALVPGSTTAPGAELISGDKTWKTPDFDPKDFVRVVNNPYFPLPRGTRYVYSGTEDGEALKDVTDITHERKTIIGVEVVVVLDRLFKAGSLVERTLDYFAQDDDGNVWYFGEDTKEFEDGKVVSTAGTWLAGENGARPGIVMRAHPKLGQTTQQEFAAGVAEDMATVLQVDAKVSVPFGSLHQCVETEDFTPLEPGAKEVKFYCPGVGFAKGRDVTGGSVRLALDKITR